MVHIEYEISKEDYEKAKDNPLAIISETVIMGYGCYCPKVYEDNGKYYLSYDRGDSCD